MIKPSIGMMILLVYIYGINIGIQAQHERLPSRVMDEHEKQRKYLRGGSLEHVVFTTQHGNDQPDKLFERNGMLFINPQAKATILVCHGFMCDKYDIRFVRQTLFADYNVMIFDFRAHGEKVDEGQCCTFGRDEAFEVVSAARYLKKRRDIGHLPCIAYGFSMGAVAAIQAQAEDSRLFNAMVLDCPYDTTNNVIKRGIENLTFTVFGYTFELPGKGLLEKFAYNRYVQSFIKTLLKTITHLDATSTNTVIYPLNPVESINKISVPCFFIHCKNDDKVHVAAAQALYDKARGFKRLWITQGRRHFDSLFYNPEKYIYKVNRFIQAVLDGTMHQKQPAKMVHDAI